MRIGKVEITSGPNLHFWIFLAFFAGLYGWRGVVGFLAFCLVAGLLALMSPCCLKERLRFPKAASESSLQVRVLPGVFVKEDEILNMIARSGGVIGKRALHGELHNLCGDGCHEAVRRLIDRGLVDWQARRGYELGVYLLTDMGKAAMTPMPG